MKKVKKTAPVKKSTSRGKKSGKIFYTIEHDFILISGGGLVVLLLMFVFLFV